MYYTFAHPKEIDFIRQEDYDLLYAKVLDGLGISELTVPDYKQMDVFVKKEKIFRVMNELSWELTDGVENKLVDFLYDDIFASLEGANFADNQADHTPLRSSSGQLQAVVEDYFAAYHEVSGVYAVACRACNARRNDKVRFFCCNYLCCGYGGVHLAHSAAEYLYSVLFGKFSAFKHFLKEGVLALHSDDYTNIHIHKYNKNIATFAGYGQK